MKLAIGIATRGRPELAAWTAETTLKNVRSDTTVIVLADSDDESMKDFVAPNGVKLSVEPRPDSVGEKWTRVTKLEKADVYMAMADYRPQITPGFDTDILKAASIFPDGIGCVYQHMANLSFPVYQSVTARMAEIMGCFYVAHFPYWFVDHWLDDICRMTGRFVRAKGETEIGHRPTGTQDFREPPLWATLFDALYEEREAIAEKLFAEMDEPQWRKDMLRRNFGLVHEHSRMINNLVRQMKGNAPFDERYKRIRTSGIAKIERIFGQLTEQAA